MTNNLLDVAMRKRNTLNKASPFIIIDCRIQSYYNYNEKVRGQMTPLMETYVVQRVLLIGY